MKSLSVVLAGLSLIVAASAFAEPPGLAKKPYGLPPGLAKKESGLPPGQAKKLWNRGERIPAEYYQEPRYFITEPPAYGLAPPPRGYRWVLVDGNAYLVTTA